MLLRAAGATLALLGALMTYHGLTSGGPPSPPPSDTRSVSDTREGGLETSNPSPADRADRHHPAGAGPALAAAAGSVSLGMTRSGMTRSGMTRSEPTHLDIPAIGIRTTVIPLGLNPDGTVQVPPLQPDSPVGWYRPLASPGEAGAAVLLGHVDSADNGPAVFYRLGQLNRGDQVRVSRADGSVAVFTITSVAEYPKSRFPSAAVYGRTDHPSLRLITCGGIFDTVTGSYRDNIVAYADLTSQTPPPESSTWRPTGR